MEFRILRYFLTVAREESISAAANFLHITQPTLSRQLIELEEELGKKLFIRGNRRITLTEEGMLLRKRAEEIVSLVEKTQSEFHDAGEDIYGDIYIGGGETDAMRMVANIFKEIQQDHPHVRYHLSSGNGDDVTDRLDKGLIDFGLLIGRVNKTKYEFIQLPAKDVWGVMMQKDSPLAEYDSIRPEQLWDVPLISSRQTLVSTEISEWIKRDYDTLNIIGTYNLINNAALMAAEGLGYVLCLDKLINTSGDSNLCFRPLEPRLEASLDIVWKKYQVFSKAAELFLNKITEHFGTAQ